MTTLVVAPAALFWSQGYRPYVVHTGSMEPTYKPGDLVIDRPVRGQVHVGDVITFRHSDVTPDLVTHRVVRVTAKGLIHTKGDANATPDVWEIRPDQVVGRVAKSVSGGGYAMVFLQQPAGIGALATAVFAVVLLWGLFFPTAAPIATTTAAERHDITPTAERRPRPSPRPRPMPRHRGESWANLRELDTMLSGPPRGPSDESGHNAHEERRARPELLHA
ncbi:signal peptidase I [Jatrophihabitans fulvus]